MRKNYNPGITFRKVSSYDDLSQVAKLIYLTDPYIYPYWSPDQDKFIEFITPWMSAKNFIFHYHNIYAATHNGRIVGILIGFNNDSDFNFNYESMLDTIDDEDLRQRSKTIIDYFHDVVIQPCQELPPNGILVNNLCVDPRYRNYGIGLDLLNHFIWHMHRQNYSLLTLDCLIDNQTARQMYAKAGFTEATHGVGFDGTYNPKIEIVNMVYTI